MSFAFRLHKLLSDETYSPKYIAWVAHGRAFRVVLPRAFEQLEIFKKYFGHNRYSSLLPQLSNHGFKLISSGPDRNSYYHECFLRGLPHLCVHMPRFKEVRRLIADPENEPNFYRISQLYPIPGAPNSMGAGQQHTLGVAHPAFPTTIQSLVLGQPLPLQDPRPSPSSLAPPGCSIYPSLAALLGNSKVPGPAPPTSAAPSAGIIESTRETFDFGLSSSIVEASKVLGALLPENIAPVLVACAIAARQVGSQNPVQNKSTHINDTPEKHQGVPEASASTAAPTG
jgi:HSF-type DNA-binding